MVRPNPRVKLTVDDYMATPEGTRCQLLDGELILSASPSAKHQTVSAEVFSDVRLFVRERSAGRIWYAPFGVIFSDTDVAQPDIVFVSNERAGIITGANIQGAPDLLVEVISPSTARYDRGYKMTLYWRHGVREYWIVDPFAETVEIFVPGESGMVPHSVYSHGETLASPLPAGLAIDLEHVFSTE